MEGKSACLVERTAGEIESRLPFFLENTYRINEIAYNLEALCDRITGPTPCNASDRAEEPRPESIVGQLDKAVSDTQMAMDRLDAAKNRLCELI